MALSQAWISAKPKSSLNSRGRPAATTVLRGIHPLVVSELVCLPSCLEDTLEREAPERHDSGASILCVFGTSCKFWQNVHHRLLSCSQGLGYKILFRCRNISIITVFAKIHVWGMLQDMFDEHIDVDFVLLWYFGCTIIVKQFDFRIRIPTWWLYLCLARPHG